ncbi:MAG TPA: accessory factor UbiK family protein [Modicisalibacter sp.]|nr:accessory factor UbiK family protein [Modicisalibacter sp.]
MASNDRISRLARQLGEKLQDASHAPEEIQRSVHSVMRGAFDRMELVSREDFDILMDVLQRTRARVEALEKQVAALEAALDDEPMPPAVVAADTAAGPEDSDDTKKPASDTTTDHAANAKKTRRAKPAGPKAR